VLQYYDHHKEQQQLLALFSRTSHIGARAAVRVISEEELLQQRTKTTRSPIILYDNFEKEMIIFF